MDIERRKKAKIEEATRLRNKYAFEDAMGYKWRLPEKQAEFNRLHREAEQLNTELAGL